MGKIARAPRRIAGGVSPAWDERRRRNGESRKYAPAWSDAAAAATSAYVDHCRVSDDAVLSQVNFVIDLLSGCTRAAAASIAAAGSLSPSDAAVLASILLEYAVRMSSASEPRYTQCK